MASSSWLWDFEDQAQEDGDAARMRLGMLYDAAESISSDAPDQKLALYREGHSLAIQLRERWWELFYQHWIIEVLLFGKNEPQLALDYAIRAVLEVAKPEFAGFPQRFDLQLNLATAYAHLDPIGYEGELRALFAHIEAMCGGNVEDHAYYWQTWGYFLQQIEDPAAVEAAFRYQQVAEETGTDHYISDALDTLCNVLVQFDEPAARLQLRDLAALGEELSRREKHNRSVAELLMWRALAARWDGQEREAKRFYARAMTLQKRLAPPRNTALYGAMKFHEAKAELEQALSICQANIRILHAHKSTFFLAQRRLDKCRLLKEMGRDFSRDAKRLRRVAAKLKSQAHWETRLAQLE